MRIATTILSHLGYWEAKDSKSNVENEIYAKIHAGYPLDNALFENTRLVALFQAGRRYDFDLKSRADVFATLKQFLTYQKPDYTQPTDQRRRYCGVASRARTLPHDFKLDTRRDGGPMQVQPGLKEIHSLLRSARLKA